MYSLLQKPTLVEENDNFYNFTSRDILEIGETASTLGSHEKKPSLMSCSLYPAISTHISVRVVGSPGLSERVLTANIPHYELDIPPRYLLHIAPDRRRRVHYFVH